MGFISPFWIKKFKKHGIFTSTAVGYIVLWSLIYIDTSCIYLRCIDIMSLYIIYIFISYIFNYII